MCEMTNTMPLSLTLYFPHPPPTDHPVPSLSICQISYFENNPLQCIVSPPLILMLLIKREKHWKSRFFYNLWKIKTQGRNLPLVCWQKAIEKTNLGNYPRSNQQSWSSPWQGRGQGRSPPLGKDLSTTGWPDPWWGRGWLPGQQYPS